MSSYYYNTPLYQQSVSLYSNRQMVRRYCRIATVVFQ
jgi:hypothetical protein